MTSATDCPSKKLGLCQLANCTDCYAYNAERQYPAVLPYRRRQSVLWRDFKWFCSEFSWFLLSKKKPIKYVRFNESGDFTDQTCVDNLKKLAKKYPNIQFYGYTARKDLSFRNLPANLAINGSNWRRGRMNRFVAVMRPSGSNPVCPGDCRTCNLCKTARGLTIENVLHGPKYNHLKR